MYLDEGFLLRIHIGETDKHQAMPLYEWLVRKAKKENLAGITVLRGIEGFGARNQLHTTAILQLSTDLPIIIEIIDTEEKIKHFMTIIDKILQGGVITLQKVQVKTYLPQINK